jgi:hypothetical protein
MSVVILRASLPAATAVYRRAMNEHDATDDLAHLERTRLRALVARDRTVAADLHAADYELITPGGRAMSRADYLDAIASGDLRYHRFEPVAEIRVRVRGDAAILRYRVAIEVEWPGGSDGGEFWHTDYWERRDGRWQAVWSHATGIAPR